MRSAAGHGALQALLASLEPVRLEADTITVRGERYDVALVEQRRGDLTTLATRARQRDTAIEALPVGSPEAPKPEVRDGARPATPSERALEIPLVRQTAELFDGTVVRALRRQDGPKR